MTKPSTQRQLTLARKIIDELKQLLRDASPPFGSTSEKREKWVRGREDALGKRGS